MKNKSLYTVIGFGLFFVGIISSILRLVGLRFTFLESLYSLLGPATAFIIQIMMIFAGLVLLYVVNMERD